MDRPGLAMVVLAVCAGSAAADAPLRVLVLEGERDAALVARVEGQVADLDAVLERERSTVPTSALAVQLSAARKAARAHDADAVVWFAQDGNDWIVHVADAEGDRVLVRRVQGRSGAMGSSAAIESAAVIVMFELPDIDTPIDFNRHVAPIIEELARILTIARLTARATVQV